MKVIRIDKQELAGEPLPFYNVYGLFEENGIYSAEFNFTDEESYEYWMEDAEVHEISELDLASHLQITATDIHSKIKSMNELDFSRLMKFLEKNY